MLMILDYKNQIWIHYIVSAQIQNFRFKQRNFHPRHSMRIPVRWVFIPVHFYFILFFGHICSIWKLADKGSNPSHSCDLCHRCRNNGSLTHYAGFGIELMPQQQPKLLQRQCQILNMLYHRGNSPVYFYIPP